MPPKQSGSEHYARLRRLEHIYATGAWTDQELAERLGVHRSQIHRDRQQLIEAGIIIVLEDHGRYRLDHLRTETQLRLSREEALALYLPTRRAARQTYSAQPAVGSALEKLARVLAQPMTARLVESARGVLQQAANPERARVVETVTRGWIERVVVELTYRGLAAQDSRKIEMRIYLIEPAVWGDGMYLIGPSDLIKGRIAALKLDRVEAARLTTVRFDPPADLDQGALLADAWGIWLGRDKPERVVLKFKPGAVSRRVQETIWHPTEKRDPQPDGLIWTAEISEIQEMVPWIRGWGADVEVLEPARLRAIVAAESRRLANLYAARDQRDAKPPSFSVLWAKADRFTGAVHRLIYHLIDVGQVARALFANALSASSRSDFVQTLGLTEGETARFVAFWAALHDLGKASPSFQDHRSLSEQFASRFRGERRTVELVDPLHPSAEPLRHERITTLALLHEGLLPSPSFDPNTVRAFARALGGHHGIWPTSAQTLLHQFGEGDRGDDAWQTARRDLVAVLSTIFHPPERVRLPDDQVRLNRLLTLFSALTSTADWIGSDAEAFPLRDDWIKPEDYAVVSAELAAQSVVESGWQPPPPWSGPVDFETLFERQPRPTQVEALAQSAKLDRPFLAIVEAPMGIGKTEIALGLYAQWAQRTGQTGLYVAMPTTATSNQMHARLRQHVARWFGPEHEPLLVHGRSMLTAALREQADQVADPDAATRQSWFLPKKRSLLAPFGVGTVDQALLSVLKTKHFFVRLFGLSHKVVIFDEVHAYDTYMSTLFERLLVWLRAMDVSVIVLSATLPAKTRASLVAAYGGEPVAVEQALYPSLSYTTGEVTSTHALPSGPTRVEPLQLTWIEPDFDEIIDYLRGAIAAGGCAAVICNTVSRAQALYERLLDTEFASLGEHLILFHARTTLRWRQETETRVIDLFGPPERAPQRPKQAIVVATQVIEQSLDLDFDVMVSELAPVDLLLQRAGRLQRHSRGPRPQAYELAIAGPKLGPGVPVLSRADQMVYERAVLLATWHALHQHGSEIKMPDDLPALVEHVYGNQQADLTDEDLRTAIAEAVRAMTKRDDRDADQARSRRILPPDDEDLLTDQNLGLEEDDPKVNDAFQALTRADPPGLSLVCVFSGRNGFVLDPEGEEANVGPNPFAPTHVDAVGLAQNAVTIHLPKPLIAHLLAPQDAHYPTTWRRLGLLKYSRLACFFDGVCDIQTPGGNYRLTLTRALGLRITSTTDD